MKVELNKGLVETREPPKWAVLSLLTSITDWIFLNGESRGEGSHGGNSKRSFVGRLALFHHLDPKKDSHSPSRLTWWCWNMPDACVLCVIKYSTRSRDLNTASTDRSTSQTKHPLPDCPHSVRKQSCCLIKCQLSFPQTQTVHRFSSINSLSYNIHSNLPFLLRGT